MRVALSTQQPPISFQPQTGEVKVTTFLQDAWVGPTVVRTVDRADIGSNLKSERVQIKDRRPHAKPNEDGNWLMQPGTDGEAQVNAQVTTASTLAMWNRFRGKTVQWSFGQDRLTVIPHKKEGMNAYYSRWEGSTNYFFADAPALGHTVKTASSRDIVSHETGHAVLDGMKPGFMSGFDRETSAFHEAFGDCSAMLATLQDPEQVQRILEQTGGDLRQQNELAHLAEEFGMARKLANQDPSDDNKPWLRNSLNKFTYVDPETLGDDRGDDDTLGGEIHSFGRLFAGAFYDCLEAAYKYGLQEQGLAPAEALKFAADTMGPLLARSVDLAPANRGHFKDIGLGMIAADQELNGGKLGAQIQKVFMDRKIITEEDVQSEQQRKSQLPDLSVDRDFASPTEAAAFVSARAEQLGLPAGVQLETVALSRAENGEQVVNLLYHQDCCVTGVPGLNGLKADVTGGVTLAFDERGKLTELRHTPIDEKAISREMDGIRHLQKKGEVCTDAFFANTSPVRDDGRPYQAVIKGEKLVRVPQSACNCGACHEHA